MTNSIVAAIVGLSAFSSATLLMPLARFLALRWGILDAPGERKIHTSTTPRLGGLAVFLSFTGVVLAGYLALPALASSTWIATRLGATLHILREAHRVEAKLLALLAGATIAFIVGLCDDVLKERFSVSVKVAGQIVAALVLLLADVRTQFLPYDWMNSLVTLLWLVGITNAFNLLDNMDGLSSGVAFVASAVLLINAWFLSEYFICLLLLAFMGSLLGFLAFNFHPAAIFLGDCGSLFIGYMMGGLTLLERYVSHASSTLFPVFMPLIVLAVPIVDTTTVVAIRIRERRPIYVGDRCHLSHRLLALGFSPRAVALFFYLATFCFGLGAVSLPHAGVGQSVLILIQAVGFLTLLLILMFLTPRLSTPETTK